MYKDEPAAEVTATLLRAVEAGIIVYDEVNHELSVLKSGKVVQRQQTSTAPPPTSTVTPVRTDSQGSGEAGKPAEGLNQWGGKGLGKSPKSKAMGKLRDQAAAEEAADLESKAREAKGKKPKKHSREEDIADSSAAPKKKAKPAARPTTRAATAAALNDLPADD